MVTQERLRELLDYDPETGKMTWKVAGFGRKVGKEAGSLSNSTTSKRRWFISVDNGFYLRSRLAWIWMNGGDLDGFVIDHKNRVTDDDRKCNLRKCTRSQNGQNLKRSGMSGYKGVQKYRDKWKVVFRQRHAGVFKTAIEAATHYNVVATAEYGEYAYLNDL